MRLESTVNRPPHRDLRRIRLVYRAAVFLGVLTLLIAAIRAIDFVWTAQAMIQR